MKKLFLPGLLMLSVYGCGPTGGSSEGEEVSIRKGKIVLAADESLQPIVDAEVSAYRIHYPEAEFVVRYVPEQKAINLMLNDSAEVAVVTRELNAEEQAVFEKRKIKYQPARMALDAVTLVVNKDFKDSSITFGELKELFTSDKISGKKLVFDNGSSSNLNVMLSRLGISEFTNANVFAANGNQDVFATVEKNSSAIGVIGNNWISDLDDSKAVALRERVKILSVSENGKDFYKPDFRVLKARKYPLERLVFMHTTQGRWGVAKGFIRFSCSQVGQLVAEKMGLLPYYIIPKEVILDKTPLNKLVEKKK